MTKPTEHFDRKPLNPTEVKILDAAIECFHRWGVEKTSLKDIAEATGITRRTIYNYFKSKDEILTTAITSSAYEYTEKLLDHISTFNTPKQRLIEAIVFVVETLPQQKYLAFITSTDMSANLSTDTFNNIESSTLTDKVFEIIFQDQAIPQQELESYIEFTMRMTLSLITIQGSATQSQEALREFINKRMLPSFDFDQ